MVELITLAPRRKIINPTEQYGYVPSLSYGIIFVVLYSISTLLQLGETVYARRYWWMLSAVCGGIRECSISVLGPRTAPRVPATTKCHYPHAPVLRSQRDSWLTRPCSCAVEIIGWAARIYAHGHPLNYTAYVMQVGEMRSLFSRFREQNTALQD